jgi:hypothetical protein
MHLLQYDSPPSTCVSRAPGCKNDADATVEVHKSPHREQAVFLLKCSLLHSSEHIPATGRSTRVALSIRILFTYACYILRSSLLCAWDYHICNRRSIPSCGEVVFVKLRDSNWRREFLLLLSQLGRPKPLCNLSQHPPPPIFFVSTASYVLFCPSRNVPCSPNPLLQFLLDTFLLPVLSVELLIQFGDSFSLAD